MTYPSVSSSSRRSDARPATRYATLALVLLLLSGFVALGVWQLERRTWKLALIERVDRRVHAAPVEAPGPARWSNVNVADDEYRHVRVTGRFLDDRATRVVAVTERGRGWWLLVPLQAAEGTIVLVNRGFVSGAAPPMAASPVSTQPVVVTGLLRLTEPRGSFIHRNDPEHDRWFSRDVGAIVRARALQRVAPYFVDADEAVPATDEEPIGGLTVIAFRNDHLGYAITWFALAVLCALAVRRLLSPRPSALDGVEGRGYEPTAPVTSGAVDRN